MNKKLMTFFTVLVIFFAFVYFVGNTPGNLHQIEDEKDKHFGSDPRNAMYLIEGESFTLVDGAAEKEIVPGLANKHKVSVFGEPIFGDLDGDYDDDVLVFLVNDSGGSGTFYYAAAAIQTEEGFWGTNALVLGDRVAPHTLQIRNGVAIANYAIRTSDDTTTEQSSIAKSKYMTLADGELMEVASLSEGEQVLFGYLTVGHEVRAFRPCGDGQPEYWLAGDSSALKELQNIYSKEVADVLLAAYAPLFAVMVGKIIDAPKDGFGVDYEHAIRISQLVRADREESCKGDKIVVTSPLAGTTITSPLTVEGYARGPWYFEADFPLILADWDGKIIARGYATAQEEWMTELFVPFKGELVFEASETMNGFSNRGTLIFQKDNPSGLPKFDDALEIPVSFK